MQPSSKNFLFGALIAILLITTVVFGVLWVQMRRELRIKNQKVSKLQKQIQELQTKFTEQESQILDTSSWKTYRNEKYGFEVRYPTNWFIYPAEKDMLLPPQNGCCIFKLLFAKSKEEVTPAGQGGALSIVGGKFIATHAWHDFNIYILDTERKISMREKGIIANILVSKTEETERNAFGDLPKTEISFNHNGYGWGIMFPNYVGGGYDRIYDQILSTFTFLAKELGNNGESTISDWKLYRSERHGIALNYPSDWEVLNNAPEDNYIDLSFRDKRYDGSLEWPGLRISVIDHLKDAIPSRTFKKGDEKNEIIRIYFEENWQRIDASCALYELVYYRSDEMIQICNKILSTFKFIP